MLHVGLDVIRHDATADQVAAVLCRILGHGLASRPPGDATRVTQWATGPVGRTQLREVIDEPDLELAGVLVYDPAKIGVDAGTQGSGSGDSRTLEGISVGALVMLGTLFGLIVLIFALVLRFDPEARGSSKNKGPNRA